MSYFAHVLGVKTRCLNLHTVFDVLAPNFLQSAVAPHDMRIHVRALFPANRAPFAHKHFAQAGTVYETHIQKADSPDLEHRLVKFAYLGSSHVQCAE